MAAVIEQTASIPGYVVSVYEPQSASGELVFTFVPKGPNQERGPNGPPQRAPQFIVAARQQQGDGITFDWSETQDDPKSAKGEMENVAEERMRARAVWIESVKALVDQVEIWAREMHWSTRRVEKKLEDDWIGKHRVPALLMQEDTCRIILEPVGRSSSGAQGVVDLYLMPAYDDIASLYYYENRWNLHYMFPGSKAVATISETEAVPLSKEALEKVLAEMRQNAA
jgi:hypothetical protein